VLVMVQVLLDTGGDHHRDQDIAGCQPLKPIYSVSTPEYILDGAAELKMIEDREV